MRSCRGIVPLTVLAMVLLVPGVNARAGGVAGVLAMHDTMAVSALSSVPAASRWFRPGFFLPEYSISPERFRFLNISGELSGRGTKPGELGRLRVNGHVIPMVLDTGLARANPRFAWTHHHARELYRAIRTSRIRVIGDPNLKRQIVQAAAQSKPLEVRGYVFLSAGRSPYMVVREINRPS